MYNDSYSAKKSERSFNGDAYITNMTSYMQSLWLCTTQNNILQYKRYKYISSSSAYMWWYWVAIQTQLKNSIFFPLSTIKRGVLSKLVQSRVRGLQCEPFRWNKLDVAASFWPPNGSYIGWAIYHSTAGPPGGFGYKHTFILTFIGFIQVRFVPTWSCLFKKD